MSILGNGLMITRKGFNNAHLRSPPKVIKNGEEYQYAVSASTVGGFSVETARMLVRSIQHAYIWWNLNFKDHSQPTTLKSQGPVAVNWLPYKSQRVLLSQIPACVRICDANFTSKSRLQFHISCEINKHKSSMVNHANTSSPNSSPTPDLQRTCCHCIKVKHAKPRGLVCEPSQRPISISRWNKWGNIYIRNEQGMRGNSD
jgi:hypothetical protein